MVVGRTSFGEGYVENVGGPVDEGGAEFEKDEGTPWFGSEVGDSLDGHGVEMMAAIQWIVRCGFVVVVVVFDCICVEWLCSWRQWR